MAKSVANLRYRFDRHTLDSMVEAVELVRDRLLRATSALETAGIPYAVVEGNAVAAWVVQVKKSAVRNTVDVNILLNREDIPLAATALKTVGLIYRHAAGIDFFLDGPMVSLKKAFISSRLTKRSARSISSRLLP